jgi:hypothetical protein
MKRRKGLKVKSVVFAMSGAQEWAAQSHIVFVSSILRVDLCGQDQQLTGCAKDLTANKKN